MCQSEQGNMRLPFSEKKSEMKGRHMWSEQRELRQSNSLEQRRAKCEDVNNLLPRLMASSRPLVPPLLVFFRPLQPPLMASCRRPITLLKLEKPIAMVAPLTPPYCQVPIPFSDSSNNLVLPFRGRMPSLHRAAVYFQNGSL
jgi:hypothetical protein